MNDYVIFAIFAAIVAVLMVICKLVYNTIAKAADIGSTAARSLLHISCSVRNTPGSSPFHNRGK